MSNNKSSRPQSKALANSKKERKIVVVNQRSDNKTKAGRSIPVELLSPSDHAFERLGAIPWLFRDPISPHAVTGAIGFDSWAGTAVGLRDMEDGNVRRVRFEAGEVILELVAERQGSGWQFVARVYSRNSVAYTFVLEAGRKRILPHADGFYLWTSKLLLRRLRLIAQERQIVFGGIQW